MGCNFYTMKKKIHIGKRSAAGWFCWDCQQALCKGGNANVHMGGYAGDVLDACPKCGKMPDKSKETFENGAVGRELGFNKGKFKAKTGIATCSSFSWAVERKEIERVKFVVDEYGRKYTAKEFFEGVLMECPIQFYGSIGREFS